MKKTNTKLRHMANAPLLLFALFMWAAFATSCKKGESAKQQTNLLTSAQWKSPKSEWKTTGGAWTSPPSWASQTGGYPATITFLDNGTYVTANASGSAGASGTWQLSADKLQLILINTGGSSMTATIATLSGSALQLSKPLDSSQNYTVEGSGPSAKYTYYDTERTTFAH